MLPGSAPPACQPATAEEGAGGFPSGCNLAPWVREPYRVWSLYDMLRFHAAQFFEAFNNFMVAEQKVRVLAAGAEFPGDDEGWPGAERGIQKALAKLKERIIEAEIPISPNFKGQFRAAERLSLDGSEVSNGYAIAILSQVRHGLLAELTTHRFYSLTSAHADKMSSGALFGEAVDDRFPDVADDIAAAGRCLALDQWTACVFHLMRVLEHGLHRFAGHLGVTMKHDLEVENWGEILNAIQGAIRRLEETAKSKERNEQLQRYSEAASQFRHFKHAWRTYVIHTREPYDSARAERAWGAVRDFMQSLAEFA